MTPKFTRLLLVLSFLFSLSTKAQLNALYGSYWNGNQEIFTSMDLASGTFTDILALTGVQGLIVGESTFDPVNGYSIRLTNLGVTVVDIRTASIVNSFALPFNLNGMEYDPFTSYLYASYWNGTDDVFIAIDINTANVIAINTLPGVQYLVNGSKTLDLLNGRYIKSTNLGITVVDIQTGLIINNFPNPNNVKGLEFDPITSRLFGTYWNGNAEILTSMDMQSGNFTDIGALSGVQVISGGESALDSDNGFYIIPTNLGMSIIDIQTGSILHNFTSPTGIKGIEYQYCTNGILSESIRVSNNSICNSDSSLLSVPGNYSSYLWSNGATSSSIYVKDSLDYSVALVNDLGCSVSSNTVSVNLYNCPSAMDSLSYAVDSCILDLQNIVLAYVDGVSFSNDTAFVRWNFVTSNADTLHLNAQYILNQNGMYSIQIAINCSGKVSELKTFFELIEFNSLSIDSPLNKALNFVVYPNPTYSTVFIELDAPSSEASVEVYTLQGQKIKELDVRNLKKIQVDLHSYDAGIYLIKVVQLDGFQLFRVIKQ